MHAKKKHSLKQISKQQLSISKIALFREPVQLTSVWLRLMLQTQMRKMILVTVKKMRRMKKITMKKVMVMLVTITVSMMKRKSPHLKPMPGQKRIKSVDQLLRIATLPTTIS